MASNGASYSVFIHDHYFSLRTLDLVLGNVYVYIFAEDFPVFIGTVKGKL